jgi:RimJ/RimL family protein N-acetyltransferase
VSHPTLETERLLLRQWRAAEDLDAVAAMNADAEVMRWVAPNRPLTRAESADLLARIVHHWDEHGFGLWAIQPHDGDAGCIGFAGLAIPSFLPAVLPAVEVGWRLAPAWWGRGYATEAARASLDFGFRRLGLRRVVSVIDEHNGRSLAVAGRLGMRRGADRLHPITRRRLRVMTLDGPEPCPAGRRAD